MVIQAAEGINCRRCGGSILRNHEETFCLSCGSLAEPGFKYPDAFMHMTYECRQDHRLPIWNARDGAVIEKFYCPLCTTRVTCSRILMSEDKRQVNYKPDEGDFLFVGEPGKPELVRLRKK